MVVENNNIEIHEVPFDMTKETLKSIRLWIDKIAALSIGIVNGERVDPNEMIITKYKMVKQLIMLSSSFLFAEGTLEEIEKFYKEIKLKKGNIKSSAGIHRNVPIYSQDADYELDECMQGIQKSLKKYFIPTISKGEKY